MKKINWLKLLSVLVCITILGVVIRTFVFASYSVVGESMEPTLNDGNLIIVNKIAYDLHDIDRFDVIVFHASMQNDFVKRVIGLPGDTIEYKDDKLYVNGRYVEEPFLSLYEKHGTPSLTDDFTLDDATGKSKVPEGKLFVMGDNRQDSLDSRSFGFISDEVLVGKVDVTYWPLSQAQLGFVP